MINLIISLLLYFLVKKLSTKKLALISSLVLLTSPLNLNFNPNLYISSIQTLLILISCLVVIHIQTKQNKLFFIVLPLILHFPLFIFSSSPINSLSQYFNYFSPKFLFIQANWLNPIHPKIYSGALLLPSLFFLPLGLFNKAKKDIDKLFLSWLLISPLVSITSPALPLAYFTSKGIIKFIKYFSDSLLIKLFILFAYFISLSFYLDIFFNKNPLSK